MNYNSPGAYECAISDITPNLYRMAAKGGKFTNKTITKKKIKGNYELNLVVAKTGSPGAVKVFFSANQDLSKRAYIEISGNVFKVAREMAGSTDFWKQYRGVGSLPWNIRVLKKGNYFRFWVNQATGAIRGPLGEWQGYYEPWEAYVGVEVPAGGVVQSFTVTTLAWLQQITEPVIPRGHQDSFHEQQAIPGAIIEYQGKYYMYFMAGMKGRQEGSSRRTVGVAESTDLRDWSVHPEPVISLGQPNFPHDNLYPNGAVVTPEGKIALMYSAQMFPKWMGFGLAIADDPLGPFREHPGNPVYKHISAAHEFDLVRVDGAAYRYLLFYAGFTPKPPRGPTGDRGYLLYSDDLVNWREDSRNPVFSPETLDNWDATHIRPRSLNKIGDTWYLWYEGCNKWTPPGSTRPRWWDTVGLARSQDLVNWEYYPRNPALPGLGISSYQFDSNWVGWPRMFIKDGIGYVFYTGGGQVGLRKIRLAQLTSWESEGGQTIDILSGD